MNTRKSMGKTERIQQRRDAGSMAERFPGVAAIVVNMTYTQKGTQSVLRTFNFSPLSYAFFRVDCLSEDCVDGGFDLTQLITSMIRSRREAARGELSCESNEPAPHHSSISYEVAIRYA